MDYIGKIIKNKRRYLGFIKPKNKYQRRKEYTIFDFLFFQKKIQKKRKLSEFKLKDIDMYLQTKNWSEGTKKERKSILRSFYKRNFLGD
jgi:hypothetical protein